MKTNENVKVIYNNKRANFDFDLMERFEAGLSLTGTEIKSIRKGQISLQEAYVRTDGRQAWLVGAHIAPYEHASAYQHDPDRERKLLLNKREIRDLWDAVRIKGMTIVPLRVYLKAGKAKLEIGIAKGKKQYDKRESIRKQDFEREQSRRNRDL